MQPYGVIGSIQVTTPTTVQWVRVTNERGWSETLLQVLSRLADGEYCVSLLKYEGGKFESVLQFAVYPS